MGNGILVGFSWLTYNKGGAKFKKLPDNTVRWFNKTGPHFLFFFIFLFFLAPLFLGYILWLGICRERGCKSTHKMRKRRERTRETWWVFYNEFVGRDTISWEEGCWSFFLFFSILSFSYFLFLLHSVTGKIACCIFFSCFFLIHYVTLTEWVR